MRTVRKDSLRSVQERNELMNQWSGLPVFMAKKIFKNRHAVNQCLFDDAVQAGQLGLLRAAELWQADRKINFNTYACQSIYNAIVGEIKIGAVVNNGSRGKPGLCPPTILTSWRDEGASDSVPHPVDPHNDIAQIARMDENSFLNRKLRKLLRPLQRRQRLILWQHFAEGHNYAVIGRACKLTREGVRQICVRAVRALRRAATQTEHQTTNQVVEQVA